MNTYFSVIDVMSDIITEGFYGGKSPALRMRLLAPRPPPLKSPMNREKDP